MLWVFLSKGEGLANGDSQLAEIASKLFVVSQIDSPGSDVVSGNRGSKVVLELVLMACGVAVLDSHFFFLVIAASPDESCVLNSSCSSQTNGFFHKFVLQAK